MNEKAEYNTVIASPEAQAAIATAQKLDEAFLKTVTRSIYRTWSDVAVDAGRCSFAGAVEVCIDADRLWYGLKGRTSLAGYHEAIIADAAVGKAIEVHGYKKVLNFLARKLRLSQ